MIIRNLKTEPEVISLRMPDGTKKRVYMAAGAQIEVPDFTPIGDLAVKQKCKILSIKKNSR